MDKGQLRLAFFLFTKFMTNELKLIEAAQKLLNGLSNARSNLISECGDLEDAIKCLKQQYDIDIKKAYNKLRGEILSHGKYTENVMIGIGGYTLHVYWQKDPNLKLCWPTDVDGFPVEYHITGKIKAL